MVDTAPNGTSPTLLAPDTAASGEPDAPTPLPVRIRAALTDYTERLRTTGESCGSAFSNALWRTERADVIDAAGTPVPVCDLLLYAEPPGLLRPTDMPILVSEPAPHWTWATASDAPASTADAIGAALRTVSMRQVAAGLILVALAIAAGIAFGTAFVTALSWLAGRPG